MGHGFKNRGALIPGKATGLIRGIPVPRGQAIHGARNAGADPRGSRNGIESSHPLGLGDARTATHAEIPDLIEIGRRGKLPQSGAYDFPGNSPRSRMPHPTSRRPGNSPGDFPGAWKFLVEFHWGFTAKSPRALGCRSRLPGEFRGQSTCGFPGKLVAVSRFPGNPAAGKSPGKFPGKFGSGIRIALFSAILQIRCSRCWGVELNMDGNR